jgi:hypothetical protein
MMDIMSEFYGSELLAPYATKAITNFCATLTTEETKDGDLAKVVKYFESVQEEDLEFYVWLDLDEEDMVSDVSQDPLGNPKRRYDEHSSKFSLSKKPRFNQPVGERNHF